LKKTSLIAQGVGPTFTLKNIFVGGHSVPFLAQCLEDENYFTCNMAVILEFFIHAVGLVARDINEFL